MTTHLVIVNIKIIRDVYHLNVVKRNMWDDMLVLELTESVKINLEKVVVRLVALAVLKSKTMKIFHFYPWSPSRYLVTITQTINGEQVTGTVTEILDISPINGVIWYKVEVTDDKSNLCLGFQKGPASLENRQRASNKSKGYNSRCSNINGLQLVLEIVGSNKGNLVTIYKPNNKKFSKQGAVSSGSRLDRLKLDTIKSGNSKCKKKWRKGRCRTLLRVNLLMEEYYKVPKGKYDAGQPRFTGWMFNGHHEEVKSRVYNMVRYNQQPLGIPQLTAHKLTLSQGGNGCGPKKCFPRTLNLGSNRATAAGNRARIPGSKCSVCCIVRIYGNAPNGKYDPGHLHHHLQVLFRELFYINQVLGYTGTVIEQVRRSNQHTVVIGDG